MGDSSAETPELQTDTQCVSDSQGEEHEATLMSPEGLWTYEQFATFTKKCQKRPDRMVDCGFVLITTGLTNRQCRMSTRCRGWVTYLIGPMGRVCLLPSMVTQDTIRSGYGCRTSRKSVQDPGGSLSGE